MLMFEIVIGSDESQVLESNRPLLMHWPYKSLAEQELLHTLTVIP
jgi:hypothetical protein